MRTRRILLGCGVVMLVACGKNEVTYDASGMFESMEVIVSAKSAGEILTFTVDEGQEVTVGEVLGSIDVYQLQLKKTQLDANKAQLDANKRQLGASKSATDSHILNLQKQVSGIKQQIENAQREKMRFQTLLKDGAASRKQVDDIGYQISVLQAQLAAAQEQIIASNESFKSQSVGINAQMQGVDAQNAGVDAEKAQIDNQIENAFIKSPIKGTVLTKYAEQGEFAVPGKPLFKVSNVSDMKLRAYITGSQLTELKIGQKVKVYADQGLSGRREYQGTVTWISDKAEFTPKTIQTRDERANLVYAIKVSVRNDGFIKRGMYGDVSF